MSIIYCILLYLFSLVGFLYLTKHYCKKINFSITFLLCINIQIYTTEWDIVPSIPSPVTLVMTSSTSFSLIICCISVKLLKDLRHLFWTIINKDIKGGLIISFFFKQQWSLFSFSKQHESLPFLYRVLSSWRIKTVIGAGQFIWAVAIIVIIIIF